MGWKPARGHGIEFNDACERERKYRELLAEYEIQPVGFMECSKTYYHWLLAERDLQRLNFHSRAKSIEQLYGQMLKPSTLRSLEQHKNLCYKPLQKLMA